MLIILSFEEIKIYKNLRGVMFEYNIEKPPLAIMLQEEIKKLNCRTKCFLEKTWKLIKI